VFRTCLQPVSCRLTPYLSVTTRTAKCCTNCSTLFRCEVMFQNEQTLLLVNVFAPAQLPRNGREHRPSNKDDLDTSVIGEIGRVHYGVNLLLISFFYRNARLLLRCVLNGTHCIFHLLQMQIFNTGNIVSPPLKKRILQLYKTTGKITIHMHNSSGF
jgi:hypothetical protein